VRRDFTLGKFMDRVAKLYLLVCQREIQVILGEAAHAGRATKIRSKGRI